jgi:anaerobic selenocysteine-containing dehydrogenase
LKSDALRRVLEKPRLGIHPEDGQRFAVEEGERVDITASNGRSARMEVKYNPKLVPGVVTVPFPCDLIDESGMAWVRIEKVNKKEGAKGSRIQGVE